MTVNTEILSKHQKCCDPENKETLFSYTGINENKHADIKETSTFICLKTKKKKAPVTGWNRTALNIQTKHTHTYHTYLGGRTKLRTGQKDCNRPSQPNPLILSRGLAEKEQVDAKNK